jgi:thiamine biosynthesis lipoprotein
MVRLKADSRVSRRRFIAIAATACAGGALAAQGLPQESRAFVWKGVALGANASLTLEHDDEAQAKSAIEACLAEVARLERIFSLFQSDSALVRLNRDGHIDDAPADMRILLSEALSVAMLTGGAFDPTIQPLWALYARHFSAADASPDGPAVEEINAALRLVDWRKVEIDDACVRFLQPGMALTLNGIAQGYITDKVGELLRERGYKHVLVNMGEELALGPKRQGGPWQVGLADPRVPGRIIRDLPLASGAIATSGGYGFYFDPAGRFSHILDPRTGACARQWASVTVLAPRATRADALSTALSVTLPSSWAALLDESVRAYLIRSNSAEGFWVSESGFAKM